MRKICLRKQDAADQCRWGEGVGGVAEVVRCIRPPPLIGDT